MNHLNVNILKRYERIHNKGDKMALVYDSRKLEKLLRILDIYGRDETEVFLSTPDESNKDFICEIYQKDQYDKSKSYLILRIYNFGWSEL